MVAFGKKLRENQIQEWQGYYINYKLLKKMVKRHAHEIEVGRQDHHHILRDFSRLLNEQVRLKRLSCLFLLEQQGLLTRRLSTMGEWHDVLLQQTERLSISELREGYREVGWDLLRLLYFVEMNAVGLRKILKKIDKRFGHKFTDYYVKTRANHPYSQLWQVFKHVGIGAAVGAISCNLADLKEHHGDYVSIYNQPAFPDQVQLLIYFMLKYAMEILLAESSVVTAHYFIWSTNSVAIFLACLGLTVLPVNIVVGNYVSNIFEESFVGIGNYGLHWHTLELPHFIPYSVPQYICPALVTFVSAEVLEGVNLSLLFRVMSSRLSCGTYNGGLLSTEAGTLAWVIADGTITFSGYLGENRLLNVTLVRLLFICISSIAATCFTYHSLY